MKVFAIAYVAALALQNTSVGDRRSCELEWRTYGAVAENVGDLDGDRFEDLGVSAPRSGKAWIHSGRDHSVLWEAEAVPLEDDFGLDMARVGSGTHARIAIGIGTTTNEPDKTCSGRVAWFAPHEGRRLDSIEAPDGWYLFGRDVEVYGDHDGDGSVDLVVGGYRLTDPLQHRYGIFSGATGALLAELELPDHKAVSFGPWRYWHLARVGPDMDGGGLADIWLGPLADDTWVFSGETGRVLRSLEAPGHLVVGRWGDFMDDIDGDGARDFCAGVERGAGPALVAFSGATGNLIWSCHSPSGGPFGWGHGAISDRDGDGVRDLFVTYGRSLFDRLGWYVSGRTGELLEALDRPNRWEYGTLCRALAGPEGLDRIALTSYEPLNDFAANFGVVLIDVASFEVVGETSPRLLCDQPRITGASILMDVPAPPRTIRVGWDRPPSPPGDTEAQSGQVDLRTSFDVTSIWTAGSRGEVWIAGISEDGLATIERWTLALHPDPGRTITTDPVVKVLSRDAVWTASEPQRILHFWENFGREGHAYLLFEGSNELHDLNLGTGRLDGPWDEDMGPSRFHSEGLAELWTHCRSFRTRNYGFAYVLEGPSQTRGSDPRRLFLIDRNRNGLIDLWLRIDDRERLERFGFDEWFE